MRDGTPLALGALGLLAAASMSAPRGSPARKPSIEPFVLLVPLGGDYRAATWMPTAVVEALTPSPTRRSRTVRRRAR